MRVVGVVDELLPRSEQQLHVDPDVDVRPAADVVDGHVADGLPLDELLAEGVAAVEVLVAGVLSASGDDAERRMTRFEEASRRHGLL